MGLRGIPARPQPPWLRWEVERRKSKTVGESLWREGIRAHDAETGTKFEGSGRPGDKPEGLPEDRRRRAGRGRPVRGCGLRRRRWRWRVGGHRLRHGW